MVVMTVAAIVCAYAGIYLSAVVAISVILATSWVVVVTYLRSLNRDDSDHDI
jgi:hypothetical protein